MNMRTRACFALSRKLMRPAEEREVSYEVYEDWRSSSLSGSWAAFSDSHVSGRDVLDFGCGDGPLSLFLAKEKRPRSIVGVDVSASAIERAKASLTKTPVIEGVNVDFVLCSTDRLPIPDQSFDTLLAFDCVEHVMSPGPVLHEWYRVLRPGGRCLVEWYPFRGPWGPHMDGLIPIPWAHFVFGQRAMFRAAEMIYDLPEFVPRHWDLDEHGNKPPNPWRPSSSFREQGFINELDVRTFRRLALDAGFQVARLERHNFRGSRALPLRMLGRMLIAMPIVGEYFVVFTIIELLRPE